MSESLAEAYPREQQRVRKLIEQYEETGRLLGTRVNVSFAVTMLKDVLARADRAAAEHDTVAMVRLYAEMQGCE